MKDKSSKKLTPRQKLFIKYYVMHGIAAQAAREAGYAKNSAKETGYELLTYPHIQGGIEEEQKKITEELDFQKGELVFDLIQLKNIAKSKAQADDVKELEAVAWANVGVRSLAKLSDVFGYDAPIKTKDVSKDPLEDLPLEELDKREKELREQISNYEPKKHDDD